MARFENSFVTYLAYFQQNAKKRYSNVHYYITSRLLKNDAYYKINDVTNLPVYSILKQDYIKKISFKQLCECYLNLHLKFGAILSQTYKDIALYPHMYQSVYCNLLQKNFSIMAWPLYKCL